MYVCITSTWQDDFVLGIADLKDVIEYVFDLNMTQLHQLGIQLDLLQTTLEKLAFNITRPEDFATKVMNAWLNQVDNAQPTLNNLAKALGKRTVGAHVQAAEILKTST